jgi:hypothetical protein
VWVISSICDYADFDFTWHPDSHQKEMIHVFPSGEQVRGDTFYIYVASLKSQLYSLDLLDWFNVINYCDGMVVKRLPCPTVYYTEDNLVEQVRNYNFNFPYAGFTNQKWVNGIYANPCLWTEKDRVLESFTRSNAICVVPRDVKAHLRTQIYDYPYISTPKLAENLFVDEPLDIVYISNGEPDAERWYEHLCNLLNRETTPFPRLWHNNTIKRVDKVNGRMAAYKAAAEASDTPWFFAVFAKLEVDAGFDWDWQPDYFQEPKHYIFNAKNPVNGLVYGHQAMIAYNKQLVLDTIESGLDFTLSKAHEVVPILSGVAHYDQDAWTTWRTAFREVIKLRHFTHVDTNVEAEFRLKKWLTVGNGEYGQWSIQGAQDAVEYYESVGGDYDQLMLSYEWSWLKLYYDTKY